MFAPFSCQNIDNVKKNAKKAPTVDKEGDIRNIYKEKV